MDNVTNIKEKRIQRAQNEEECNLENLILLSSFELETNNPSDLVGHIKAMATKHYYWKNCISVYESHPERLSLKIKTILEKYNNWNNYLKNGWLLK
ncbi:hypothetical protein MsAc7_06840 [Methanolapillus millepedarum]|uniref:Uncharacterized protein n=2 Tax=Methanolapillus millepedarum TaxID=3028296 RepID=A0AA96VEH1_9EURY|nr:hypothetical protein MsAc7_06840 [Methanosarcinaceae archaeon Ac7]